uniref:ATP-dependent DNA helicase n=1 Tax=Tanacetum cinerariifolium TaxID=118510 RepID=A0A699I2S4_TANCI|nr:hypothetical protein [Tanacetum cinerariifolium]
MFLGVSLFPDISKMRYGIPAAFSYKLSSPKKINNYISAGLPSKDDYPIGFEAVLSHMIHGPYGAYISDSSCMKKEECTKGYLKRYCKSTYILPEGWPDYARPNNIRGANVGSRSITLDNRYVVPHNKDLLVKYDCHINVEWCNQGSFIKYLFSYITKGSDRSTIVIESGNNNSRTAYQSLLNNDSEITGFLNCRYVSACEACWKIFNYDLHYRSITVERLPFHEEECNIVYFRDNNDPEVSTERILSFKTKYTEWMVANQKYPEGHYLTYVDYPTMFTWHDDIKHGIPRRIDRLILNMAGNKLIVTERMYIIETDRKLFTELYSGLNSQHKDVFNSIMQCVVARNGGVFFMYGCGGTGKTYLWRKIISRIRLTGKVVLSVASSEIASLLLPGGRTSHSRFRIPIDPDKDSCYVIDLTYDLVELITLLEMGNGRLPAIALDDTIVGHTFLDLLNRLHDIHYLKERCILCSTNDVVDGINSHVLEKFIKSFMSYTVLTFCRYTRVVPSYIPLEAFPRFMFEFVKYDNLKDRYNNDKYLTGKNNESVNSNVRNVVIHDLSDNRVHVTRWKELALKFDDDIIRSKNDQSIVVTFGSVVFTGMNKNRTVVIYISDLFEKLMSGVAVDSTFILDVNVVGVNVFSALNVLEKLLGLMIIIFVKKVYKLVLKVGNGCHIMDCVFFNQYSRNLLGVYVDDLVNKALTLFDVDQDIAHDTSHVMEKANDSHIVADHIRDTIPLVAADNVADFFTDMFHIDVPILYAFTNEIIANVDVLASSMKNWVPDECYC